MPLQHFTLPIDPMKMPTRILSRQVNNAFKKHPEIVGLSITIDSATTTEFWSALKTILNEMVADITLKQFAMTFKHNDSKHDFTPVLQAEFLQNIEMLCIEGPISGTCFENLQQQLVNLKKLSSLSLTTSQLELMHIVPLMQKMPHQLKTLDLSWNPIKLSNDNEYFQDFWKAIQKSKLKSLTLTSIGSAECGYLESVLPNIYRLFKLTLISNPLLKTPDLTKLTCSMKKNPYLSIRVEDMMGYFKCSEEKKALDDISAQNATLSLQKITSVSIAELFLQGEITPMELYTLPPIVVSQLPLSDNDKVPILSRYKLQQAISALSLNETENDSPCVRPSL